MKKILIFVLFLIGCSEEHEIKKKICNPFRMTISDALPVQFWVNGVETYNQKEVCGITPVCFCQPFNCDDEIRIQFNDESYNAYKLQILDSLSIELELLNFYQLSTNVWEIVFIPSDYGICDENIQLKILASEIFDNADFEDGLSDWYQVADGGLASWSSSAYLGDNGAYISINTSNAASPKTLVALRHEFTQITPTARTINYNFRSGARSTSFGSWTGGSIVAVYFKNNVEIGTQTISSSLNANTTYSGSFVTNQTDFDVIAIRVEWTSSGSPFIGQNEFYALLFSTQELNTSVISVSDCIDIKTSHDCTALIRYDNAKDFAGIEYSDFSPTAEFYLRIPAIFFHERNTEEEENFEESTENIVRLRNEIKLKKLLEVGFMPDYMHRKLLLILAHDTVEIDGESWIKRDPYEKEEPGNKRYPLKKASVLLTQKDYIKRNIL